MEANQKKNELSERGLAAVSAVLRSDLEIFFEASKNLYEPVNNPNGAFPLNVAENVLNWPILKEKIKSVVSKNDLDLWTAKYTSAQGHEAFRNVLARFLSRYLFETKVSADHLGVSAGATAIIEMSSWILCDPGDIVVIPAPSYPTYTQDIGNKALLERYDLVTFQELGEVKNKPVLNTNDLERTRIQLSAKGKRFKLLIITNPDNPTGSMYVQSELDQIADWCIQNKIHLIVNEIYGLSILDTKHPELVQDYPLERNFSSFAQIIQSKKSNYLHLWYALSKDFGVSGFRVGVVHTLHQKFMEAFNNLNAPHMVSNITQWIFQHILSDDRFIEGYIKYNQILLTDSYLVVVRILRALNIPYIPPKGSLFVWIDLSEYLVNQDASSENDFWLELYRESGVLLTPGDGFGHSKFGQFRLVYTCIDRSSLQIAMFRMRDFLLNLKVEKL